MTQDMSDDMVKQAIIDLQELVRCICSPALKDRNLHSPDCRGYDASNVALLSDRIEELDAKLSKSEALLAEAMEDSFFAGFAEGRDGGWAYGNPTPAFKVYIASLKGDKP